MLTALIGPIASIAGTWLEGRVEKTKAKVKADVAKAQAEAVVMQKKATGEIDWDLKMADASASSWKDEWLVILFSIPLILAFIPGMEDIVSSGFQQLEQMQSGTSTAWALLLLQALEQERRRSSSGRNEQWLRAIIEYNAIARLTMIASIAMSWRCAEWFMNLEDPTMQQSAFVSVIMGVMTGIFSI